MIEQQHRIQCANKQGGREWFVLDRSGTGIRIGTPGALTRTRWSLQQAARLRDALTELLDRAGEVGR